MTEHASAWQDPWNRLLHKANRLEIELAASENAREGLERQRDALLAALETVEWVFDACGNNFCGWCREEKFDEGSHAPDCQRQAAIATVKQDD